MPQIPQLQIPQMGAVSGGIDFAPLGQLGQIYAKRQQDEANKAAIAAFQQTGDTKALLGSGDMSLIKLGTELEQNKRAEAFRQQTHADTVNYQNRSLGLQERAQARADAAAEEGKFVVKEITNADGTTSLVRVKTTGPEGPLSAGAASSQPANPFSAGGKFNEGQGKAAGFTDRMLQSEGILSGTAAPTGQEGPTMPGVQGEGLSRTQNALSGVWGIGNSLIGSERQKFEQAKADFINAQLRRESGAAISPTEFENANKQYFPVPGDQPAVIAQKAANRRAAIEAMGREGGPAYRPKLNYNEGGVIQPLAQGGAAAAPPTSTASSTAAAPVVSPTSRGGIPRPTSRAGYDAMPSGTVFIAPDGSERVKP